MKGNTKTQILDAALELFSKKGYDATSVNDIASAIGIKAPSLYAHYQSKMDIFTAIFAEMDRRYQAQMTSLHMHLADSDNDVPLFGSITPDGLAEMVAEVFRYSLHDEYVSRFRKMMTIEQFRSAEFAALYSKRYLSTMLDYHEKLFALLINSGTLRPFDPHIMALQFASPVYALLSLCDREPEKEAEALSTLKKHVWQFSRIYGTKTTESDGDEPTGDVGV